MSRAPRSPYAQPRRHTPPPPPKRGALPGTIALVVAVLFWFTIGIVVVRAETRCVTSPANVQHVLDNRGRGAEVCFEGTFKLSTDVVPLRGQTIVGGTFVFDGTGNRYTSGFDMRRGSVTLRNVEVAGFPFHGIVCGNHSTIRDSYVHNNLWNGIGCHADGREWSIRIIGNTVTHNGSTVEEHHSASGIKLLSMAMPKACLGCGAIVRGNNASNNIGNGIWFDQSSSGIIARNNVMLNNTHHGIRCEKCAGPVLFDGNTTHDNTMDDVSLANCAVVRVLGATGVVHTKWTPAVAVKDFPRYGDPALGYKNIGRVVIK